MESGDEYGAVEAEYIRRHHRHETKENQCTSALVKHIKAPVHLVSTQMGNFLDFDCFGFG